MGLEYVRMLAQRGYNVIIVALFQNETDAVAAEMAKAHPDLDFLSIGIDLSAPDAPKKVYDTVAGQRPGAEVEVLINNAGILHARHFRNMTPAQVSSIIMVHNHATALLCSYWLPAMLEFPFSYDLCIDQVLYQDIHPCPQDRVPEDRCQGLLDLLRSCGYSSCGPESQAQPYSASRRSHDTARDSRT